MTGGAQRAAIEARWSALMRELGRDPEDEPARHYGETFMNAWLEPHRRYHGPAHLLAMLDRLEDWEDRADDPAALKLAAFAHDAVYQRRPGADERESALMAEVSGVALGLAAPRIDRIRRWIEATAGHAPQPDNDGALFLDADLEILAAEPAVYDAYAAAIREEYASVPDTLFRAGRKKALQDFLDRPAIYGHPRTPPEWEAMARANLAREIARLDGA